MLPRFLALATLCALSMQGRPSDGIMIFSGDLGLKTSDIRNALHATKSRTLLPAIPGVWKGWRLLPDYSPAAAQSDALSLRNLYYQRGYFDAEVKVKSVAVEGGQARIAFTVHAGPHYAIHEFNGRPFRSGSTAEFPMEAVCRELLLERRQTERTGVFDFAATLEFRNALPPSATDSQRWTDATAAIHAGPAYRIGRIEFRGNHSFADATLRRSLLLEEGDPLDRTLLGKSLARLTRTGWFEPLTERSVLVHSTPDSDRADVIIQLQETKPRNWYLSGPVGPMSIGGPLRFAIGSRLPGWGRGVFELSTYAVSANLVLFAKPMGALLPFLPNRRFVSLLSIQRPTVPGQPFLSGFGFAPQLGWRGMLAGYGMSQTRGFLHRALETSPPSVLPVTIENVAGEGTMSCALPRTTLDRTRQIGETAINLLLSFSPF